MAECGGDAGGLRDGELRRLIDPAHSSGDRIEIPPVRRPNGLFMAEPFAGIEDVVELGFHTAGWFPYYDFNGLRLQVI